MNCTEKLLDPTIFFNLYQVTIEFRFRKSLRQEKFKSNLEFRYQIIVLSIKLRKGFAKLMIPIAFVPSVCQCTESTLLKATILALLWKALQAIRICDLRITV